MHPNFTLMTEDPDAPPLRVPPESTRRDALAQAAPGELLPSLPSPGMRLPGNYILGERLGHGGMGEVFSARDLRLRREVAIKFLRPEWSRIHAVREAFIHEARLMASMCHMHVVEVFEYGAWVSTGGEVPYIIMNYLGGTTLAAELEQQRREGGDQPVDDARAFAWLLDLCAGVGAIHEAGFAHGDLSPHNLIFSEDGRLVVADLGVAGLQVLDVAAMKGLGTAGYRAPELRAEGPREHSFVDGVLRDVWAAGAIAYEVLGGRPYCGEGKPGPPLGRLRPDLSPRVLSAVTAMLECEPARRANTMTRLARALASLMPAEPEISALGVDLLVLLDDDPDFLALVTAELDEALPGVEVRGTELFEEAQIWLSQRRGVLLTDLDMPEIDGLGVIEELRSYDVRTPIVLLSARADPQIWRQARDAGADACFPKPVDVELLIAVLEAHTQKRAATASA